MIERLRTSWNLRTTREKRLLLALFAVIAVFVAWLGVVRPLDNALADAKARHDRAVIARAQVDARVAALRELRAAPRAPLPGSIADVVQAEVIRAGFVMNQVEPAGTDGARIIITAARPQTFFAWVTDLETRLGLDVEALTARPNADQTLAVDVTFRRGSS